jgi:hypothetical protein
MKRLSLGGNWMVLLFTAFLDKRGSIKKLDHSWLDFSPLFIFSNGAMHLSSPIKTKASKIMFSAETGLSEILLGPG